MTIKEGGQIERIGTDGKIVDISIYSESPMRISLVINQDSLSYLSVEEAVNLRDFLNTAIRKATQTNL